MPTATYAAHEIAVDDEGFFTDPSQWTEQLAPEIARAAGLGELNERQWRVVRFMRAQYEQTGAGPSVRALAKASGIPIKELYELFPKGPAKLAARIAGIPKPRGCI
ncbi:MAG TPA: TusE/DsrC/DsvC family sulfur relay protein [Jatrophihabitantaceae bacterium]|jgi:tRNA 2-thiouridine synthesizing protein E|nr:TusE/DsrC/DsvC family sulfur relay protein [Jatrophihabitantaceae bacterium]